ATQTKYRGYPAEPNAPRVYISECKMKSVKKAEMPVPNRRCLNKRTKPTAKGTSNTRPTINGSDWAYHQTGPRPYAAPPICQSGGQLRLIQSGSPLKISAASHHATIPLASSIVDGMRRHH